MTGRPPFYDLDPQEALEAIVQQGVTGMTGAYSPEIKDFCNVNCLRKNPDERPSAEQLLHHPYIVTRSSQDEFKVKINHIQATCYEEGGAGGGCTLL